MSMKTLRDESKKNRKDHNLPVTKESTLNRMIFGIGELRVDNGFQYEKSSYIQSQKCHQGKSCVQGIIARTLSSSYHQLKNLLRIHYSLYLT